MSGIIRLDSLLANQIAAGEVIERPASVIKELVENSLDAGADRVDIAVEDGGTTLIRVSDNGSGIPAKDLMLALDRHTTSKLASTEALEAGIATLGFRGEALASISSVSRLTLLSATRGAEAAQIRLDAGSEAVFSAAAHPVGTTVEVRDLFFNTPGRRKFLRATKTEFEHIDEWVRRIALSFRGVSFTLRHQQKVVRQYRAGNTIAEERLRLGSLCGTVFAENAVRLETAADGLELTGWLGLPAIARARADLQYFYVNGRIVRDRAVSHALRSAYHDVLYGDRHPAYVLFLTVPPAEVDVNVHPAKHEVRFRSSRMVHDFVRRGVKQALASLAPCASGDAPFTASSAAAFQPARSFSAACAKPVVPGPSGSELAAVLFGDLRASTDGSSKMASPKTAEQRSLGLAGEVSGEVAASAGTEIPPLGFALAQLKNIYILAENVAGLVLVDMHAAHERVLYEKMKQQWQEKQLVAQPLLVPLSVRLEEREAEALIEAREMLQAIGMRVERLDRETVVVREVPGLMRDQLPVGLVRDLAADLLAGEKMERFDQQINAMLGSLACRAAVHARRTLSLPEMNALLRVMEATPHSAHCNHGRPAVRQFTLAELDRFFLRGR